MVAADDHAGDSPPAERGKKVVQQTDRLGRWHAAVIDIPRDQHHIGAAFAAKRQNLRQDLPLVFKHTDLVNPLAEVKI